MPLSTIYEHIERAIKVGREMFLDRQYVVRDGEIVIVDEFTGRLGEGRKWRAGIHQAVEAKEGVKVTFATIQAARITVQDYLPALQSPGRHDGHRQHQRRRAAQDLQVPRRAGAHQPPADSRKSCRHSSSARADDKWQAIIDDIVEQHQLGPARAHRHALDRQERATFAPAARSAGIEHSVLNARHVAKEAEIVAAAGQQRQSDRGHEHGRPRHRHPPRPRRARARRPARDLHRAARSRSASTASSSAAAAAKAIPARIANSSRSTTKSC